MLQNALLGKIITLIEESNLNVICIKTITAANGTIKRYWTEKSNETPNTGIKLIVAIMWQGESAVKKVSNLCTAFKKQYGVSESALSCSQNLEEANDEYKRCAEDKKTAIQQPIPIVIKLPTPELPNDTADEVDKPAEERADSISSVVTQCVDTVSPNDKNT
ncbi:unnamed protein product [Enterobius vermicularis]|uniref:ADF-H domain-containing protein n=1 Tax=Enterobius vermicularis TaxID=51028 RepID=A0A0N4VQ36_ENTVE|nr:unnamed protein product [Enterobius vermicularis]